MSDKEIDGEEEFGFSRNYFLSKESGASCKKSANKLSDIDLVDEQELRVAAAEIEGRHEKEIKRLMDDYRSSYSDWLFQLRCGFGLLMYGFGSKKALLEDFASTSLIDYSVFVVNGYLHTISIKQVTIAIAELLWEQKKGKQKTPLRSLSKTQQPFSSRTMDDLLAFLHGTDGVDKDEFICILIHNIDGPGLRDSETQQYLARIASCAHIRMVASIDHVNAPLQQHRSGVFVVVWDKKMVHTQFNWCWYHVPTYSPYTVEGMFFPMILAHGGTAQTTKTAALVLQSLTPNAQSVFKILAEHQLAHPDEEGMPVNDLYTTCREQFLVTSQVTLNSHLTEFKDHELVKVRRHSDGQDCLHIPLTADSLKNLIHDINI